MRRIWFVLVVALCLAFGLRVLLLIDAQVLALRPLSECGSFMQC